PTNAENTSDFVLPMINIKYNMNAKTDLRFAWTKSFSRPSVFALVPHANASRTAEEVELGNPNLDALYAMNIDLSADHYMGGIGIVSASIFYKKIKNFIYTKTFIFNQEPYPGFEATQPLNGNYANLYGFSISFQDQLTFLPGFLSGFGIYANY